MRSYNRAKSWFFSVPALLIIALELVVLPSANAEVPQSQLSFEDLRTPRFHQSRPEWGVEVTSSLNAFGGKALIYEQGTSPIYAFSIQMEYQPAVIQSYGVLGIGPSVALYPPFNTAVSSSFASLWAAGGQIRYQARYFREQILVPMIAYSAEYFNYDFQNGNHGNLIASGPTAGVWLLMNSLEKASASQLYLNNGVTRSYVVLEYRTLTSKDPLLAGRKGSYYFGLRFEM
jgi:hypothetical protein